MFKKLFKKEKWHREDLITMARYNPDMDEAVKEEKRILRKAPGLSFRERLKMFFLMVLMFVIAVNPAWATNTHTTELDRDSSQYWSRSSANTANLAITGDISIEVWVKPESLTVELGDEQRVIVSKFTSTVTGNNQRGGYFLGHFYDDRAEEHFLRFGIHDGTSAENNAYKYTLSTSAWTHIAITWDASEAETKFYINGSLADTVSGSHTSINFTNVVANFLVGGLGQITPTQFFDGAIDDVRVWNVVRTSTEIANNYNCSLAGNEANLQGYWRFDNNGNDSTSNGNDLTNNNSATFQSASLPFTATCGATPTPTPAPKQSGIIIFE